MSSPAYPRRPVSSSLLRRTEYVGLQERMAQDSQRLTATGLRDDDADSLELPELSGGITGTTGYESLLEAPTASDLAETGAEAAGDEQAFSGPSARRTQLMPLPQLEMPDDQDLTSRRPAAPGYQGVDIPDETDGTGASWQWTPSAAATAAPGGAPSPRAGNVPVRDDWRLDNSSRQAFVRSAYPFALEAAGGDRNLAELIVAKAISENGQVGTGADLAATGYNFSGIKGTGSAGSFSSPTWEQVGGRRVDITDQFAAYGSPREGFGAFMRFLEENPRYGRALAAYRQSGDASQLFRDVNLAGYATDPQWAGKVENIRAGQVAPLVKDLDPSTWTRQPAAGSAPPYGTYTGEGGGGLVLNQFTQSQAEGLPPSVAMGICGPTAALAFARANNGRMPTLSEARELATRLGLYSDDTGMKGPTAESKLLDALGVPHTLAQGADEAAIARDVSAGRPVIVDTSGHYFAIEPGSYDAATRTFDFGGSAAALKASRGRTRYRLDEIASLGMGAPRSTFFLGTGR